MSDPTDGHGLLRGLIDELERINPKLESRTYPHDSSLHSMDMAVWALAGFAIRQLGAASCLIDAGWAPESHSHIRTTWDLAVDLWFLLSKKGTERSRYARMYLGMSYLRAPSSKLYMETIGTGARSETHFARAYRAAQAEFGHSPIKLNKHWSGLDKGEVRRAADSHMSEILRPLGLERALLGSKATLFDYPSQVVHGDPGSILTMPTSGVRLRTTPRIGGRLERLALSGAVGVGLLMLTGVNRRFGKDGVTSTGTFNARVREFLSKEDNSPEEPE